MRSGTLRPSPCPSRCEILSCCPLSDCGRATRLCALNTGHPPCRAAHEIQHPHGEYVGRAEPRVHAQSPARHQAGRTGDCYGTFPAKMALGSLGIHFGSACAWQPSSGLVFTCHSGRRHELCVWSDHHGDRGFDKGKHEFFPCLALSVSLL